MRLFDIAKPPWYTESIEAIEIVYQEACMGVEDNIRDLLSRGYSPKDIIRQGFTKSTVYKVYKEFIVQLVPVTAPAWEIHWELAKERYLPGQTVSFTYWVRNSSGADLYVYRAGLQPAWLSGEGEWYAHERRFLLHPGAKRQSVMNIVIPPDIPLGAYEMRWGMDAQFVGPGAPISSPTIQTQWTEPFMLDVKKPLTDDKVFISHSTRDLYLVRQLQCSLDNEGIEGIIAEDSREPGIVLEEKFKAKIRESHFFLAFLTSDGVRSDWVIFETKYALDIKKPSILLKEKEAQVDSPVEWVEFSRYDHPETIIAKAQEALQLIKQQHYGLSLRPSFAPLAIGVLGFLFGLAAGKSAK